MNNPPKILVARAIFPDILDQLAQHFQVDSNQEDRIWPRQTFIEKLQATNGVLTTTSERIDAELLAACPDLCICSNMAVGFDNFDVDAMTSAGVLGTNAPNTMTETTADLAFVLLMVATRKVNASERFLRDGRWNKWHYEMFSGSDVHGTTLGVIGMGRVGQAIARRGVHGFGMNLLYTDRQRIAGTLEKELGASFVTKDMLLREADHVVLSIPYSVASHHTIGAVELSMMKRTATLVNISRGGIVDDAALAIALREGLIAGAGLDVFEGEPRVHVDLLSAPNLVLTPHIGSASAKTRHAMAQLAADNLIDYLVHGNAKTSVNTVAQPRWHARAPHA